MTIIVICSASGGLFGLAMLRKWRRCIIPFGYSDALVQMIVLRNPERYAGSLVLPYASATAACADWPWRALWRTLRIAPLRVEAIRYVATCALAGTAIGAITVAFGGDVRVALLGICLLLGSRFAEVGWWFRPGFSFFTTHGLVGLAWGALVLGLALGDHNAVAIFALAGLLLSYHPVHGLIVSGSLGLFWITGVFRPHANDVLQSVLAWLGGLLPLVLLGLRQRAGKRSGTEPSHVVDIALWWKLMTARTCNIFALAGLDQRSGGGGMKILTSPPILAFTVGLLCLWGLGLSATTSGAPVRGACVIWLVGIGGFLSQLVCSDLLRVPVLARLALARAGTYMTFFACVVWAMLAVAAVTYGGIAGGVTALLCLVAVSWVPKADNSWIVALSLLPLIAWQLVDAHLRLAIGVPALLAGLLSIVPVIKPLGFLRLGSVERTPLVCLAGAALLAVTQPSMPVPVLDANVAMTGLLICAMALALRFGLRFVSPLRDSASEWEDIQRWAGDNTAPGSLFVTPPHITGFEIFSERPKLMDGIDIQMTLYVPSLMKNVIARCGAYGITLEDLAPMSLMPRLVAAHRELAPTRLAGMRDAFGVRYAIFEKRPFNWAAWPGAAIAYTNGGFIVVNAGKIV